MRLVVVDAEEWLVEDKGKGLGGLATDQERSGQSRAKRRGHGVDLIWIQRGVLEGQARHGDQSAQVFASRHFRHYASVLGVQPRLRRNEIASDLAVLDNRDAGFVTGRLEGEKGH
jgi:hypothetical protein